METFIVVLNILALIALAVSIFLTGEGETIALFIACALLFIGLLYNRFYICNCVTKYFSKCS